VYLENYESVQSENKQHAVDKRVPNRMQDIKWKMLDGEQLTCNTFHPSAIKGAVSRSMREIS
jgi:hypothetical protein